MLVSCRSKWRTDSHIILALPRSPEISNLSSRSAPCRWLKILGTAFQGDGTSEPEALLAVLKKSACRFKRIGLEAGPLSQWLYGALAEADLAVICVETRHMRAVLKAQINKTDRNDARGMAQMMRVGLYRPVHVKTLRSQKLRMLLTHRKLLQPKTIAIENDLRGTLRSFGLEVGIAGKMRQRRDTVEHPFGTIKARMGATHFLMKTLPRVATEMALHVLAYNLTYIADQYPPMR